MTIEDQIAIRRLLTGRSRVVAASMETVMDCLQSFPTVICLVAEAENKCELVHAGNTFYGILIS
jgi:hypothetical protein